MKLLMKWAVVALAFMLGACNTIQGFGQDMSAAGRGVSNAAVWVGGGKPATAAAPATATAPPTAGQGSSAPVQAPAELK